LKTSLFNFELPESLIATEPANPRDAARMLVISDAFEDKLIADLPSFLRPGDVVVFNDTRVIPARLFGKRGEAGVEILLHKNLTSPSPLVGEGGERGYLWQCFARPSKKIKSGDRVFFAENFHAEVIRKLPGGEVLLQFNCTGSVMRAHLERHGHMPLPPYIEKKRYADESDKSRYQTVYAKHEGSVAAPTAGLHFTDKLLSAIDAAGATRAHVTLHVGGGTFLPVKTEDTDDHIMHSEFATITPETADLINREKANGGRVIAVGTTSLRTLESAVDEGGTLNAFSSETDIFITPGYRFKIVDMLLTNFHLPRSTLFMLVSAFCGLEKMQAAYAHAITSNYRFYSYGDACLLYRQDQGTTEAVSFA